MSDFGFIPETNTPRIRFESAPIHNLLCSLCLLNQDHVDHISSWVDQVLGQLSPEEKESTELGCEAGMFVGDSRATTLAEFAKELRHRDPSELARIELERLHQKAERWLKDARVPALEELSQNRDAYLDVVRRLHEMDDKEFHREHAEREYERLQNPECYRDELAETLEHFWNRFLRDEWSRVQHDVEDSVAAFRSVTIPGGSLEERLKFVTGRENIPADWVSVLSGADEIVYVPSVHIGPYMILFDFDGSRAYIVGRARIPEGASVHSDTLDRSDLLIRLDALSDATRVRILELAAQRGLVTSQDVMDELELSQSSASRHLAQLAATGLLLVDASERTKKYRVNPRRVDEICGALKQLITARSRA
jgi:DNA-binding transcriptional ArsR family regulator